MKKKILVVFGTRPEIIKLAPFAQEAAATPAFDVRTCLFRQHKAMAYQALEAFGLRPTYDLPVSLSDRALFGKGLNPLRRAASLMGSGWGLVRFLLVLKRWRPDAIIVQGDTSTAFLAAFLAFHLKISIVHIEAGLRTHIKYSPFPEEMNRKLIGALADFHFAPTEGAQQNLLREGVDTGRVWVVGNTAMDALRKTVEKQKSESVRWKDFFAIKYGVHFSDEKKLILVTAHRRENFGEGIAHIGEALRELARSRDDIQIILPVHQNPNVRGDITRLLAGISSVFLVEPLAYESFVYLMRHAYCILTDSGGIQEEASFLGCPTLVMRESTERAEVLEGGTARLVGTDPAVIVKETIRLLDDKEFYRSIAHSRTFFGDGHTSERILEILSERV